MTKEEIVEFINENYDEDILILEDYDYCTAFIGISNDDRAVYSYDLMIEYLINKGFTMEDAIEWIETNTLNALPYYDNSPIIVFDI